MKKQTVACLMASLIAASSFAAEAEQAKQSDELFASLPRVLTEAELNQLEMPIRFSDENVARWAKLRKQVSAHQGDEALQKKLAAAIAFRQRAARSPVGLFLAKSKFRLDEPATAYFVVKNASSEVLELDLRLDLHFGEHCINSCGLHIECLKVAEGYERPLTVRKQNWHCGGPSLLTLPKGGYYCTSGDLRTLGADVPGDYRMHWVGAGCRSQDVAFTILPPKNKDARFQPIAAARVFKLGDASDEKDAFDDARKLKDPPLAPLLDPAHLVWSSFEPFAAGLATGVNGRFYPDILNLPVRDKFISATARFEKPAQGAVPNELVLLLRPLQRQEGLVIRNTSHVYLIASSRNEKVQEERDFRSREAVEWMVSMEIGHSLADPTKPLAIRFRMQEGWQEQLRLSGDVQIRVLICSEEIEPQSRWPRLKALEEVEHTIGDIIEWKGLLGTPAVTVRIPDMNGDDD